LGEVLEESMTEQDKADVVEAVLEGKIQCARCKKFLHWSLTAPIDKEEFCHSCWWMAANTGKFNFNEGAEYK
jgi:hypothetical protein